MTVDVPLSHNRGVLDEIAKHLEYGRECSSLAPRKVGVTGKHRDWMCLARQCRLPALHS